MPTGRTIAITVAVLLFLPLLVGLAAVKWVESQLPRAQGERVRGPHELVGVQTQGSYAWVVPAADGVVLVDAGLDPKAGAIEREIGGRKIHAILLTHGHGDHTGGLAALGHVPVYAAPADIALAKGEREPRGLMSRAFSAVFGAPPADVDWQEVADGTELRLDGLRVHVVAIPGHTDGSLAYLWEDVLFTGDAVLGGDPLSLPPESLDDDPQQAAASLKKLLPLDFDAIADGHVGITTTARKALFRLAGETLVDPTLSVRSPRSGGDLLNSVHGTGVWVTTPVPDARGEQPTYLVLPDGQQWRIVNAPMAEHAGKRVTVQGHRVVGSGGPGIPVEVDEVTDAADSISISSPSGTKDEGLQAQVGQWVTLTGSVSRFHPLAPGAQWGEGAFRLEDGQVLSLSAPVSLVEGAQGAVALFGQLKKVPESKTDLVLIARPPPAPAPL